MHHTVSRLTVFVAWLLIGVFAMISLSWPSVVRTQEGRVLVTAQQMMGKDLDGHLIPELNGRLRLQKPPMAYWLATASFSLFGVSACSGRLPFAICAWLTAGLVYLIGVHHFGRRTGLFAMCSVLGCVIGARYALLAETDVLTMLGVTAAMWALWRAVDAMPDFTRCSIWFHAASVATAFTVMSKGPQAAFPFLFFLLYVVYLRRWDAITWWIASGAPLTAVVLGGAWFVYVFANVGPETIVNEVRVATMGGAHQGSFLSYFAYLSVDLLPWTAAVGVAVIVSIRRWRRDPRTVALLLWTASILLPLCFAGQKQRHYLLPLLPPLMLLGGWLMDRALRAATGSRLRSFAALFVSASLVALFLIAVLLPIAGAAQHGRVNGLDGAMSLVFGCLAVLALFRMRRLGHAKTLLLLCMLISPLIVLAQNVWAPTLDVVSPRSIASEMKRRFPDRPLVLVGRESLGLQFELQCSPDVLASAADIQRVAEQSPDTVFIDAGRDESDRDAAGLLMVAAFPWDHGMVRILETRGGQSLTDLTSLPPRE